VSGEHEIDEWKARVFDDRVRVVGLVSEEDDGALGTGGDGDGEIRAAGGRVLKTTDQEAGAVEFNGDVAVVKDRDAVAL